MISLKISFLVFIGMVVDGLSNKIVSQLFIINIKDLLQIYSDEYLYERDVEVAKIGWELNQLRIKRRIYDYVVTALS